MPHARRVICELVDTRTENPIVQGALETTGGMGFYMIRFML